MQQFGVVPSQDEIDLFFQRYDKDRDGKLRYAEFCEIFVPLDGQYAQIINARNPIHRSDLYGPIRPQELFMPLTLLDLKETLRTHFRVEMLAEELRQRIEANPFFSLATAFQVCDLDGNGEVTRQEIMQLCQSRGLFISDKDAVSIMDKFDKHKRGAITKNEFVQEMVPKSPNKRLFQ